MRDPASGLPFFTPRAKGLPEYAFLSYDAVDWIKRNVQGVGSTEEALKLLQSLVDSGLVCHASGSNRKNRRASSPPQVRYGYFIYGLVSPEAQGDKKAARAAFAQDFPYSGDEESFDDDWIQVRNMWQCGKFQQSIVFIEGGAGPRF